MSKPLWLTDIVAYKNLQLTDRLELLRRYFCCGPCGQADASMRATAELDSALKQAASIISELEEVMREANERRRAHELDGGHCMCYDCKKAVDVYVDAVNKILKIEECACFGSPATSTSETKT